MSSSFTDPNDSQAESENNFLASYMMDVEDDRQCLYWENDNRCVKKLRARLSIRGKIIRFRLDGYQSVCAFSGHLF